VVRGICIRRKNALLHPRAACGGEQDQWAFQLHGAFGGGDDGVAHIHAHRPAHEGEILRRGDDGRAADLPLGHQHRLGLAGRLLRRAHPVGIFLLVAELQRVGGAGHRNLGETPPSKSASNRARRDRHVVAAIGADVQASLSSR
jgi:hypothetical protein